MTPVSPTERWCKRATTETMHISLRLGNATDTALICALAKKIWNEHYPEIITQEQIDYMLDTWYNPTLIAQQIADQTQDYWMVTLAGADQPCGYLALSKKDDQGGYYLNKFYLEGRGKGIGAAAFRQAIALYPDLKTLRLNVNRRNIKSVNFYFKMGFKIESVFDLPVGDRYIMDDFIMLYHHV